MSLGDLASAPAASPFQRVLAGIRVIDFCWVGAGALVTKLLADVGAEVIKVGSRRRPDSLRTAPPFVQDIEGLERSGYFASRNTSKKSFALNMKHPAARETALGLVRAGDVVANNFCPDVMERWGLSYDEVAAVNPAIIYLTMPMQGGDGPHRDFVGFGSTASAGAPAATRTGNRVPGQCPHGVFPCNRTDAWCAIAVGADEQWLGLVRVLGSPVWAQDPALGTLLGRRQRESEIEQLLAEETRCFDPWALMEELQENGVPAAVVENSRDLVEQDRHLKARAYWHYPPHDVIGEMAINGPPFRVDGQLLSPFSAAPLLGQDTRELALELLGYSEADFDELADSGLFE